MSHDPDPLWRLQTHIWNQYCKILAMLRWCKAKNLKHKEYLTFCTGRERHKPASKGILTDRWCAARCDASPMAMHLNSNLEIRHNLPNHPGLGGAPIEFGWVYSATQSALLFCCICIVLCSLRSTMSHLRTDFDGRVEFWGLNTLFMLAQSSNYVFRFNSSSQMQRKYAFHPVYARHCHSMPRNVISVLKLQKLFQLMLTQPYSPESTGSSYENITIVEEQHQTSTRKSCLLRAC